MRVKNYHDGGEAILEALRNLGVDYIISSPGSEWSSVWEALAPPEDRQPAGADLFDVWHETTPSTWQLGYTQITGKMQAVLLHAGAGLMQGAMAIQAAQQTRSADAGDVGRIDRLRRGPGFRAGQQWYRSLSIVGGPQRLIEPVVKHASMRRARSRSTRPSCASASWRSGAVRTGLSQRAGRAHGARVDAARRSRAGCRRRRKPSRSRPTSRRWQSGLRRPPNPGH